VEKDVLETLGDLICVRAATGEIAIGHVGEACECSERDAAAEAIAAEGAIGLLHGGKGSEAFFDCRGELGRDLIGEGVVLGGREETVFVVGLWRSLLSGL
jgi:hypothetical protein